MGISKVFHKIPPFKNIYRRLDILEEQKQQLECKCDAISKSNEKLLELLEYKEKMLKKANAELKKKYDYVFSVEQRYEKNMNSCYENLKKEVRDNKKTMDSRHEYIYSIEQSYEKTMNELYNELKREFGRFDGEINKDIRTLDGRINALDGRTNAIINKIQTVEKDIRYNYYKGLHPDQYPEVLKEWYRKRTGEELNLDNPTTYNEKIQWMKLYDSTETKAKLADKYLVREYVKDKIGDEYLVDLIGEWKDVERIPFEELPNKFVLKANHGCGYNIIVKDKNELNVKETKERLSKWLNTNFAYSAGLELHYKMIDPRIIAEEYIENSEGELNDYKVFCFNGKAEYIMFLKDRNTKLKMAFYDVEWNKMPFVYSYERLEEDIPKPDKLDELIRISEKLAEGFPHVRVDFYITNEDKLKFGEMTFTSYSGACIWNPPEYNKILGDKIQLPQIKNN